MARERKAHRGWIAQCAGSFSNAHTQRESERESQVSDVHSTARDDDEPELLIFFLHDCPAYQHITQLSSEDKCSGSAGTKNKDKDETFMEFKKR